MSEYGTIQPWNGTEAQQQALAGSVQTYVSRGWRVESAPMPGQVVVIHGRRPNHILHLLLSIVTMGLWLPVWLIVALSTKETRAVLTATPDGTVMDSLRMDAARQAALPWWRQSSNITALVGVAIVLFGWWLFT
jgi:hypothetical protein